jgi:hypothetical protein
LLEPSQNSGLPNTKLVLACILNVLSRKWYQNPNCQDKYNCKLLWPVAWGLLIHVQKNAAYSGRLELCNTVCFLLASTLSVAMPQMSRDMNPKLERRNCDLGLIDGSINHSVSVNKMFKDYLRKEYRTLFCENPPQISSVRSSGLLLQNMQKGCQ